MKRTRSDSDGAEPELQKRAKGEPDHSVTAPQNSASEPPAGDAYGGDVANSAPPTTGETAGNDSPLKSATASGTEKTSASASGAAAPAGDAEAPAVAVPADAATSADGAQPDSAPKGAEAPAETSAATADKASGDDSATRAGRASSNATTKDSAKDSAKDTAKEAAAGAAGAAGAAVPSSETPKKPTTFSAFTGSGGFSGFSGSSSKFQSIAKSSGANPWAESAKQPEKTVEKKAEEEKGKFRTTSPDESAAGFEKQQDLVTGEEDEETQYSVKVRLYAVNLDSAEKSWKERGVGTLKLNSSRKDRSKKRLLMRADSVLRVSLNLPLVKNTQLSKGFHSSLHTEKFLRISSIEDGQAHQFAVKLVSEDARNRLYEELESALTEI